MKTLSKINYISTLLFLLIAAQACGGGSSGGAEKELLVEGLLTEGSGNTHGARFKHDAGAPIETVSICALGKCSETDGLGQWGFTVPEELAKGDVLFTLNGHGISTEVVAKLPAANNDIYLHFEHSNGKVIVHHMEVDGVRVQAHDEHDHASHSPDSHEHNSDMPHSH